MYTVFNVVSDTLAPDKPFYQQWWFLVIIALIGVIIVLIVVTVLCVTGRRRQVGRKGLQCFFYDFIY
jgi:threonine/homoserine/homoserine lactone efflux protein